VEVAVDEMKATDLKQLVGVGWQIRVRTYVANHRATITAWLRIFASTLHCRLCGICLPMTKGFRLSGNTFSVTRRFCDESAENVRARGDVLPVFSRSRTKVYDVRAGEALAD
jgi:hypothetical protein